MSRSLNVEWFFFSLKIMKQNQIICIPIPPVVVTLPLILLRFHFKEIKKSCELQWIFIK